MAQISLKEMEERTKKLGDLYDRKERLEKFIGCASIESFQLGYYDENGTRKGYLTRTDSVLLITANFMSLDVLKTNARAILKMVNEEIEELETVV